MGKVRQGSSDEVEHELTDCIKIDFSLIPDYVKEDLAATTFNCVLNFMRQPGGKEFLDAKIAEKKLRKNIK